MQKTASFVNQVNYTSIGLEQVVVSVFVWRNDEHSLMYSSMCCTRNSTNSPALKTRLVRFQPTRVTYPYGK